MFLHILAMSSLYVILENGKLQNVYLFLFDEFLLITKIKRNKKVGPIRFSHIDAYLHMYCNLTTFV